MKTLAQIQADLVRALSLPERTTKVVLTFEAGKPPTVSCEYALHAASGEGMLSAVADFELVPKGIPRVQRSRDPREVTVLDVVMNHAQMRAGSAVEAVDLPLEIAPMFAGPKQL